MMRLLSALMAVLVSAGSLRAGEWQLLALQYPPYEYLDPDTREVKGVATELVRQAFARMGQTVKIQVLPWPRILWMVKHGQADGFFTSFRTPDREEWADFSKEELVPQVTALFARKGAGIEYKGDLASLSGRSIGVVRAVSYGARFDQAVRNGVLTNLAESVDGETNFHELLAGRIEIAVSNCLGAKWILARMAMTGAVEELSPPLESLPSYLGFSKRKNLKALRDHFDQVLAQMKADGTWARIMKQADP